MSSVRKLPNIIITGTPGCGKTSHAIGLTQQTPKLNHISISEFAKQNNCIEGHDKVRNSDIVDEEKLLDILEDQLREGGKIIDWHVCDIFPERLVDLVIVLRCDNSILFDRLSGRGYSDNKVQENLDVEIMDMIIQEAKDSYKSEIVIELRSDDVDEMETNISRVEQWVDQWINDHPEGVSNEIGAQSEDDYSD